MRLANGCPWVEGTCSGAAAGGHLEVRKWARANGCPWNDPYDHLIPAGNWEPDSSEDEGSEWEEDSDDRRYARVSLAITGVWL